MDTGRDNVELKESPFVRLRVGLERSINHLLNGILGKSGDEDVLVREPRNRRQSEKTNLIVDDHETNSSSVSEPIHIHIRQLQKISPDEGSEEVYRVRFIAEENGKKRSDLSRLIVDALSALGMEELSKNLGTDRLQV